MESFHARNVVITGGTRGIGRAIACTLAQAGAHVYALYARNRKAADSLVEEAKKHEWKITPIRGDLTDDEAYAKTVAEIREKCDQIHIIVHSAASGVHRPVAELSDKHMRWTMDINYFVAHKFIMSLIDKVPSGGRIIGLTSPGGARTIPHYAAIGASKGALESLFRHYAVEFAKNGIAVNLVCPGMVMTDAAEAFPELQSRLDHTVSATPTGQLTQPEQVAHLVHFLCQKEASQIVGQTIVMDGGKGLSS